MRERSRLGARVRCEEPVPTFVADKVVEFKQRRLPGVTARGLALALAVSMLMAGVLSGDASASSPSTPAQPDSAKTTSTPDPTPLPEPTSEPTPEATPEPTPEAAPEPTPEATPEPTPEATPEPTPEATPEPTPEATPEPTPEPGSDPELSAYFPMAISQYVFNQNEDVGTQTLPEAAGGAGGFTYSLSPDPPEGLSFDPASRALSGAPAEAGDYTMAYTATDEAGDDASFEFTITVQPAPQTALQVGTPAAPTVTRAEFSEPTNPALDVTWTTPAANGLTISWFQLQYRKQAAEGEDPAEWTIYDDPVLESPRLRLSNLEAGAVYEVQVRAGTNEEGLGDWSDTGTGTANRPPTATGTAFNGGTFPVGATADYNETGPGALGVFFADADGDTLTYTATAQHPALLGVSLSGDPGEAQLRATLLNQGSSNLTYTATDAYGGSVTRTATIVITAKVSREIAENSAAGTAVGAPVTGTPYNNVALSYTLEGKAKDSGKFVIDSATGQISVAQGATLDYATDDDYRETETFNGEVIAKFYRGEVKYTVDGHAAVINVSLIVTEVLPGKPGTPTLTRTTSSKPMDPALDAAWTAADANGLTITGYQLQYRKQGTQDWTPYAASTTAVTLPRIWRPARPMRPRCARLPRSHSRLTSPSASAAAHSTSPRSVRTRVAPASP